MLGDVGSGNSRWCRDNLSQSSAEKEIRLHRQGRFLVWRGRSLIDFYLSYVDVDDVPHHLPIKQLGKSLYFEGLKFFTLPELVVYHLTTREFSDDPVRLAGSHKRESLEATHIALVDTLTVPAQPVFSVRRGDLLAEVGRLDERWLLAKHLPTGCCAFFDLTQTSILSDVDALPNALPYFHNAPSEGLSRLLSQGGRGSFLLRHSRHIGSFTLLVHTGSEIQKFLIDCSLSPRAFLLSGRQFHAVADIVHRYSTRPISNDCCLVRAMLSEGERPSTSSGSFSLSGDSEAVNGVEIQDGTGNYSGERRVIASVTAFQKAKEEKEWKKCTLTLYEEMSRVMLEIGDPLRGERSGVLLGERELVCLHESLLGRDATVFLSPISQSAAAAANDSAGLFLSFDSLDFHFTWLRLLRAHTRHRTELSPPLPAFSAAPSEFSVFYLHLDKYRTDSLKPELWYRATASINGVAVCCSRAQQPAASSSIVFDTHFAILGVPRKCDMQLSLSSGGRGGGKTTRPAAVSPLYQPNTHHRTLNLPPFSFSASRHSFKVFQMDAYGSLVECLLPSVLPLCEWAVPRLSPAQRPLLPLLLVTLVWPRQLRLLFQETLGKTMNASSSDGLLRQDSFGSCLVSAALRLAGRSSLEAAVETLLQNKKKEKEPEETEVVEVLVKVGSGSGVRGVLAELSLLVSSHFPSDAHIVRRALSAAFILRFANPLLLCLLGCSSETSSPQLARSIQMAANAASSASFVQDGSNSSASRLFDFFEYIRTNAESLVSTENGRVSGEQPALLCHLLCLALDGGASTPSSSISSTSSSSSFSSSSPSSSLTAHPPPDIPPHIVDLISSHRSY